MVLRVGGLVGSWTVYRLDMVLEEDLYIVSDAGRETDAPGHDACRSLPARPRWWPRGEAMDGVDLDTEQADAVGLLAVVVGQDVETDDQEQQTHPEE